MHSPCGLVQHKDSLGILFNYMPYQAPIYETNPVNDHMTNQFQVFKQTITFRWPHINNQFLFTPEQSNSKHIPVHPCPNPRIRISNSDNLPTTPSSSKQHLNQINQLKVTLSRLFFRHVPGLLCSWSGCATNQLRSQLDPTVIQYCHKHHSIFVLLSYARSFIHPDLGIQQDPGWFPGYAHHPRHRNVWRNLRIALVPYQTSKSDIKFAEIGTKPSGLDTHSYQSVQACGVNRRSNSQMTNHWNTSRFFQFNRN